MHIIQAGKRYDIDDKKHYITMIAGRRMVLCHDDGCQAPLVDGFCKYCGFSPDTQSRQFAPVIDDPNLIDVMLDTHLDR